MGFSNIEIECFDGKRDFSVWRERMKAILVQMKVAKVLYENKPLSDTMKPGEIEEIQELAYNIIILYLSDKVIREVS